MSELTETKRTIPDDSLGVYCTSLGVHIVSPASDEAGNSTVSNTELALFICAMRLDHDPLFLREQLAYFEVAGRPGFKRKLTKDE